VSREPATLGGAGRGPVPQTAGVAQEPATLGGAGREPATPLGGAGREPVPLAAGVPREPAAGHAARLRILASPLAAVPRELAARVAGLPGRRQERVQDAAVGVTLAAVNVVTLLPYRAQLHPLWVPLVLVAAQGVPLIWRRSWPVPVMIAIGAVRSAYDQAGFMFAPLPLGPAIALYTVIDRSRPVLRWITVAATAVGIAIGEAAPGHNEPYDAIVQAMIFTTAWSAGVLARAKRARIQEAQGRADRAEAELDRQVSRAALRERARIARELHDVVAHHVSLIAVQAEAASSLLPDRPAEAERSVDIIGNTARMALAELRRLLGVLRGPSDRPQTAPAASLSELGGVLDQVRSAGLAVSLEVTGQPCPLAPGVDLTAFRIVQEALTNTVRHASAARADVALRYEPGFITVSVTDSGPGRDGPGGEENESTARPGALPAGSGLGLAGIAERVASCGGSLTVGPAADGGFGVTARLPWR
jgi:signal transduction histidine kinase